LNDTTPPPALGQDRPGRTLTDHSSVLQWVRGHALEHGFELDAAQEEAISHFQRLREELLQLERGASMFARLLRKKRRVRGLYLWGGVGRGKSFLMDSFFSCAPPSLPARRVHFHRFMQEIHQGMHRLQGQPDPLRVVARNIAGGARLLCLDEFHITDITDAMLMRRLLEGLLAEDVVLITTSNFHPDALYEHGLQRGQFLPAISLLKQHLDVVNVDSGIDYRLRELEKAGTYHTGPDAEVMQRQAFAAIVRHEAPDSGAIEVEGRNITVRLHAPGVAWFDFNELCDGPRGKPDYIELAYRYHTILISGVPRFGSGRADALRRFVWMVDEFYDRRVKLILSAAAPAAELIVEDGSQDGFHTALNASLGERLVSRLTEMQSRDYLGQPHLPG